MDGMEGRSDGGPKDGKTEGRKDGRTTGRREVKRRVGETDGFRAVEVVNHLDIEYKYRRSNMNAITFLCTLTRAGETMPNA